MGCSRARHRADGGVCHSSVRQRTTANEPANHGPRFTPHCWLTRHTPRTTPTQAHPRWRPGGSAPQTPRDLSPLCQARREKQKRDAQRIPSPILAPESALGSRLRVALSSAQVTDHFICDRIAEPLAVRAGSPTNAARSRQPPHSGERLGWPNPLPWGTCQESNRWLCVRSTRSSAVVFFKRPSNLRSNPISGRIQRHTVSDPQRRQP